MKNVHIQIKINEKDRERFQAVAKSNSHNASDLIRKWIEEYTIKNEEEAILKKLNEQER